MREGFELFWRPAPAPVIHHQKQKTINLGRAEFVLIGPGKPYIISISVTDSGTPLEAYININLPPEATNEGWCWRDLELDLKALPDYTGRWSSYVIDVAEFRDAGYDPDLARAAQRGVQQACDLVKRQAYPFTPAADPWLGGPRPEALT